MIEWLGEQRDNGLASAGASIDSTQFYWVGLQSFGKLVDHAGEDLG